MARMHPKILPAVIYDDRKRSSEVQVYEKLQSGLSDDFEVFYSRSWHAADNDGHERDGEADFIVAHPEHGLLFLEVKGGRIRRRDNDGQWLTTDRDGFDFRIKDPVAQARSSKHHFLKRLKSETRLGRRFFKVRHGVVLPGSARPSRDLGPDAPLRIFAFGDDMADLGSWTRRRMSEAEEGAVPFGMDGMFALQELLANRFELRSHIGESLSADSKTIERLTADQAWILDSLEDYRQLLIPGGAGTGKTVLAIEKAIRSAAAGRRTLLTCFNAPLAAWLKRCLSDKPEIVVASFHALCASFAKRTGIPVPASADPYDTALPEAFAAAVERDPSLSFDTIIVDEGQDFQDHWLTALRLSLCDLEESEFYVFLDSNQRLYERSPSTLDALPKSRFVLRRNLRNTKAIHRLMNRWYVGEPSHPAGPDGELVSFIECRHADQAAGKLNERIVRLLKSGQVLPGQVAVLSGRQVGTQDRRSFASIPSCGADELSPDRIAYDSIWRFKGLSRPCVFLIDIEETLTPALMYVATSRANLLLEIIGTPSALAAYQEISERLTK